MRWTDPAGDHWPITGDYCKACGLPLTRTCTRTTHPCCDPHRKETP